MKKLGFGLMRLPLLDPNNDASIDMDQLKKMVDIFIERGFTYFDTAIMYNGFASQRAAKEALVDRYPRDSFTLATKLHSGFFDSFEDRDRVFNEQLEQTGAGYFDYYLLHALMRNNYAKYERFHLWDFVSEQKAKGLIRNLGFSFHADPKLLDEILTAHPEVDFVQLQINYADWENPKVTSRANYEVARKHGKLITVMEPVKGGSLANPPEDVQKIFREIHPDMSFASWAIRFVASLDGILTVLSGMSNVEQMQDNLSYMKNFQPLNEEEQKAIQQAQRILGNSSTVPCTACRYCTEGCPQQIPIPDIFSAMNRQLGNGQMQEARESYYQAAPEGHRASNCVECRQCEGVCPQHIAITDNLKQAAAMFEI